MQPEKPATGLATPDLVMSRAEVERRGGAGVDSGHDNLVGNGGIGSTSAGEGRGTARRGGDRARHDKADWAWRGMEHSAAAYVAQLDVGWGRRREAAWGRRTAW